MFDRHRFFTSVRHTLFGSDNTLTQEQVDGCNALLDGFEKRYSNGTAKELAYYLATAYWETNQTMQPVKEAYWLSEEWRRKNLRYYPWYGRGYVQLTWEDNYKKESQPDRTGIDLVSGENREKVLEPETAAQILFVGMEHGDFGGGGMTKYFGGDKEDPVDARHLVNGIDHAQEIADIYWKFKAALVETATV